LITGFADAVASSHEVLMCAQTRNYPIDVTVEDASRVAHRLANAQLDVMLGQDRCGSAQAGNPHLEGDPRPVRRRLKQHRYVPALERPLSPPSCPYRQREVEHVAQLGRVEIGDVEKVAAR